MQKCSAFVCQRCYNTMPQIVHFKQILIFVILQKESSRTNYRFSFFCGTFFSVLAKLLALYLGNQLRFLCTILKYLNLIPISDSTQASCMNRHWQAVVMAQETRAQPPLRKSWNELPAFGSSQVQTHQLSTFGK